MNLKQYEIEIRGLVQGVGFRPYVYKLANEMNLKGYVNNDSRGVNVFLEASVSDKDQFVKRLYAEKPDVAEIAAINVQESEMNLSTETFYIAPSKELQADVTRVSPDIAVCEKCMHDFQHQEHRVSYPFINCTHCGPRFTIIKSIPYDRPSTTMNEFKMCEICESEYTDPSDRRFHAQPVACNHCGPSYKAIWQGKEIRNYIEIVTIAREMLRKGAIVALKGTGGFNLLCDAQNEASVQKLRELKHRYVKPFAVMYESVRKVKENQVLDSKEETVLTSWRRPIVVLKEKRKLSESINGKLNTIGVMLPYLPIHYDLFRYGGPECLVVTSANRPGEPMLVSNTQARNYLDPLIDLYIEHNRDIHNRVDDSVVRIINEESQLLRRARGYTPEPYDLTTSVEGGLAFGAEITGMFAIGKEHQIILSQYIGDLTHMESVTAYKETMERLIALFRFKPEYMITDKHPQYESTRMGNEMAEKMNLPVYRVQHHHAHAVSAMVEFQLNEACLAITWDGTGFGDDGRIWGGELLRCDRTHYERVGHLPYVPMPGGDKAAKEPWRMALSYVVSLLGKDYDLPCAFVERIGKEKIGTMKRIMESGINQTETSSAGRLFDAVSSLLGLCDINTFQAEAAMKLEHTGSIDDALEAYQINDSNPWDLVPVLDGILSDINKNTATSCIAKRFHLTCAEMIAAALIKESSESGIRNVILTGGVFQNKLLTEILISRLQKEDLNVYYQTKIPCNDGGIPVGQLAAIAAYREKNKSNTQKICMNYQLQ